MKTLILLSTLVLLAFQALADQLPEANEEAKIEEQPVVEVQDVSILFGGPEVSAFQGPIRGEGGRGGGKLVCSCRRFCNFPGRGAGFCGNGPKRSIFCCH